MVPSDCASFACASTVASPERTMAMPAGGRRGDGCRGRDLHPRREGGEPGVRRLHLAPEPAEAAVAGLADALELGPDLAAADDGEPDADTLSQPWLSPIASLSRRTITASISGSSSAAAIGSMPSAAAERQRRAHVPADHRAGDHPELAAEAAERGPRPASPRRSPAGSAAPGSPGTLARRPRSSGRPRRSASRRGRGGVFFRIQQQALRRRRPPGTPRRSARPRAARRCPRA